MNKVSNLILTAALSLGLASPALADTFETKRCVNMGNALDAPNEGDWGHTIDLSNFAKIKAAGFDTVRIPVRWSAHTGGAPNYTINPRFAARVDQVLDAASAAGLNVIVNVHHFEELNEDPDQHYVKFVMIWHQVSRRYANRPSNVYFEIINEPNGNFSGNQMRAVMTGAVQEIRRTNPTRILILGGENWNSLDALPSIPKINDPNQVYTFHYYNPFEFTHQKAEWTHLKNSGTVKWGSQSDRDQLNREMDKAARFARESGKPLFVGEFGAYQKAPYKDTVEYYEAARRAMEERGLSWCAWNFTATYPLYDSDRRKWDTQKLGALGLSPNGITYAPAKSRPTRPAPRLSGQSIDDAFNALRSRLPKDGKLMTRPYARDLKFYGSAQVRPVADAGVPSGQAVEINVSRSGNPWDSAANAPLSEPIRRGDVIVMSFYAKALRGEGKLNMAGVQLNREPYEPLLAKPVSLSSEWQQYYISARASRDYAAGETAYTFHLSGATQTIRMGPLFIVNLGPRADMSSIPTNP